MVPDGGIDMRVIKIKLTEQLYSDMKRGAKARGISVAQFAVQRLAFDRYDLITQELLDAGHMSLDRCNKNETVL